MNCRKCDKIFIMNENLKVKIHNLVTNPGVYLMYDKAHHVIYVGKAKNLKNRVSQYFLRPQVGKVMKMVLEIEDFETIVTRSEKEALILELNLIQTYYPKFNILLKDDKHYPYIALKKNRDPYLQIARKKNDRNTIYFGPFPSSNACYEMIDILNTIFPLRKCQKLPKKPCLYYHMHECLAPCINVINEEEYAILVERIKRFLNGDNKEEKNSLIEKMKRLSEKLDFEGANRIKKMIMSIDHINDTQRVEMNDRIDRDIIAFSSKEGYVTIAILTYKKGVLLGKNTITAPLIFELYDDVASLIEQYYLNNELPKEIIVGDDELKKNLDEFCDDAKIIHPQSGKLYDILLMAQKNAVEGLILHFQTARLEDDNIALIERLGEILHIATPYRIELFDNSHLQGDEAVGAMVAFINGLPNKKMYRKYNLENIVKKDDLLSMKEVIYRRYHRLLEENQTLPDLILVDGGVNQIRAANEVLVQLNCHIPVFGLFKDQHHNTKGLIDQNENIYSLENDQKLFFLLVRMQDEVHRFAISFHHQRRSKSLFSSPLDDVEGLGEKRKMKLLTLYGSVEKIQEASLQELSQVVPKEVAKRIKDKLDNISVK